MHWIEQHPRILRPKTKEVHFFDHNALFHTGKKRTNQMFLKYITKWVGFCIVLTNCLYAQTYPYENLDSKIPNQILLLTFPHSGTNLLVSYLQATTFIPVHFLGEQPKTLNTFNRINVQLDETKNPIFRNHGMYPLLELNNGSNKLILIYRNYREVMRRFEKNIDLSPNEFVKKFTDPSFGLNLYIKNLQTADLWDSRNVLIISFENLLINPLDTMKSVLQFIDEPIPSFLTEEFLKKVSDNCMVSVNHELKHEGGCHTAVNRDILYYTRALPIDTIQAIDSYMEKTFPDLWQKYLSHYKFKE